MEGRIPGSLKANSPGPRGEVQANGGWVSQAKGEKEHTHTYTYTNTCTHVQAHIRVRTHMHTEMHTCTPHTHLQLN